MKDKSDVVKKKFYKQLEMEYNLAPGVNRFFFLENYEITIGNYVRFYYVQKFSDVHTFHTKVSDLKKFR